MKKYICVNNANTQPLLVIGHIYCGKQTNSDNISVQHAGRNPGYFPYRFRELRFKEYIKCL